MLEIIIFVMILQVMISLLYVLDIGNDMHTIYDNIAVLGFISLIFHMVHSIRKISYKENKKYIRIEKLLFEILDISKADRIGLVEYHMQFASLTMIVAHNKKYYDILGQWVNMPISAINKWRADKEWLEVHNSATYPDREIGTIAQSYNHVSIHHAKIPDIDGYSYGYVSMMYCEELYTVPKEDQEKINLICEQIAEIIKEDKFEKNIAFNLKHLHSYKFQK
jgi:hypothetical protein